MKLPRSMSKPPLAAQIRLSYIFILIPIGLFLAYSFFSLWRMNSLYENMLNSVVTASRFSLDFKEDFDFETYLVIAGNTTIEESKLGTLLDDAGRVVGDLMEYTVDEENIKRLENAGKYLENLETYVGRIAENIEAGDRYEDNILIWENDVQIVTGLLQETINEYIYYENRELQDAQAENRRTFIRFLRIMAVMFAVMTAAIAVIAWFAPIMITKPIEEQVRREQTRLRKAEFELLQAQINPHFLYNTLDAIVWSAEAGNNKQVVSMVGSLSEFFRTALGRGKEIVTIREELQHVRSYLEIQQIRYQDILAYQIDVPESVYDCTIPKITIQPLVENALYHGIKNRRGGGRILIEGAEEDGLVLIRVIDNGAGMDAERLADVINGIENKAPKESAIYGLYNVNERIRLNFGEQYGISISSSREDGTVVTIRLPKNPTEIVNN